MVLLTLPTFPLTALTTSGVSGSLSGPEPLSANTLAVEHRVLGGRDRVVLRTPAGRAASTNALAVLLAAFGSNWSASLMVPVLVCAAGLTTRAVMLSVCGTPELTVPTVHTPLTLL